MNKNEYDWTSVPKRIIKSEMIKRDITQQGLTELLNHMGISETKISVNNKLTRGMFSAIFFLQCLKAMGVKQLSLDDDFFYSNESKGKK